MGKIGISTDSGGGLEYVSFKHNVKIARIPICYGDQILLDGLDTNANTFYQQLESSDIIPSTCAPYPSEIIRCANECLEEGCSDVIHIPLSTGLSAYGSNLQAIGRSYVKGIKFHVHQCHTTCIMQAYMAKYAEILSEKNYSVEEILDALDNMQEHTFAYFVVDNLKYLVKNGRLSAAMGFIGGIMKIKPIIFLGDETGLLKIHEKVRTLKKALEREFELIAEGIRDAKEVIFLVQDSGRSKMGEMLVSEVKKRFPDKMISVGYAPIAPSIGSHSGPGLLGVGAIILDDLIEKEELKKI